MEPSDVSPWLAVNLSLLFPGLGQWRLGNVLRGSFWLLGSLLMLAAIFWCYLAPQGNAQLGAGLIGMGVVLWAFNLIDAHACALGGWKNPASFGLLKTQPTSPAPGKSLSQQQQTSAAQLRKSLSNDPWFSVLLSQIMPGLGQLYCRQYGPAALLLGLTMVVLIVLAEQFGLILGLPALAALAVYQICALAGANPASGSRRSLNRSTWQRLGMELAIGVFVGRSLLFATVPMVRQVVEPFSVPSESMFPTLMVGDRILVHKRRSYQPQSGDIIVFQDPTQAEEERLFVKRVVGIAGDRIEVEAGKTRRNGQVLDENYINNLPRYVWDSGKIPPRHVVVLGDNRNASFDSSHWGPLPLLKVVGRVYRVSWPPEHSRRIGK